MSPTHNTYFISEKPWVPLAQLPTQPADVILRSGYEAKPFKQYWNEEEKQYNLSTPLF